MPATSIVPREDALAMLHTISDSIPEVSTDDDFDERSLSRIFSAETLDDAMMDPTAVSLGRLAGHELVLHDVRKYVGGKNKKIGYYYLLDVEDKTTGVRDVYSSGSPRVMGVVARAYAGGLLPLVCSILTVTSEDTGNTSHYLVKYDPSRF